MAAVLDDPPATTCSCPSRKFPCKHALALLLLRSAERLPEAEPLEFVTVWLARRARRPATDDPAVRAPGELADPAAAAKRAALRAERVAAGLDELEQWLRDQVRAGLASLDQAGYAPFEALAARMVDAQAPGVAGLLRSVPGEIAAGRSSGQHAGDGWPARLLDQFGLLHLLARAHGRLDRLDPAFAATVRSRIGYPVAKDDVLMTPGVVDHWVAVGMVETVEYRLETRRVWLYGAASRRWAMLLSFAVPGSFLGSEAAPGDQLHARLHFYPGSGQLRALVGARTSTTQPPAYPVPTTWTGVQDDFARLLATDPWATRMPAAVAVMPLPPRPGRSLWGLRDVDGVVVPAIGLTGDPWLLVACATGGPVGVVGEWSSAGFRLLALLPDGRGTGFSTALPGVAA